MLTLISAPLINSHCLQTHAGLFNVEILQVFDAFSLDELVSGQSGHVDVELLAIVNKMLTYKIYKYIQNICISPVFCYSNALALCL